MGGLLLVVVLNMPERSVMQAMTACERGGDEMVQRLFPLVHEHDLRCCIDHHSIFFFRSPRHYPCPQPAFV